MNVTTKIEARIKGALLRYGQFASTHEAMGVALEEWAELQDAVRANDLAAIESECVDLAAVLIRLARDIRSSDSLKSRSIK